jgi:hypothetical protein
MFCFFPTRGALPPSSSLRPFAFKVPALHCRSLPWPYDFIPSAPRLSECSKWYTACLDGMRRYLPRPSAFWASRWGAPVFAGGIRVRAAPLAVSPPGSLRSSFPARWCCRSCLLLAAVGGARLRGGWHSSAIAQLQGFSSCSPAAVSRQWSSTRMTTSLVVERSEPGCGLPPPSASRMFIILAGVEGEPSWGPAFRMGW